MATYMFQFSYAVDAVKGMVAKPQNRRDAAEKVIAAAGGRLLDMYFCFGDYDGVATAEFSSNVDAAAASLAISSSGGFADVQTTVLITMDESVKAMEKAGEVSAAYAPPRKVNRRRERQVRVNLRRSPGAPAASGAGGRPDAIGRKADIAERPPADMMTVWSPSRWRCGRNNGPKARAPRRLGGGAQLRVEPFHIGGGLGVAAGELRARVGLLDDLHARPRLTVRR